MSEAHPSVTGELTAVDVDTVRIHLEGFPQLSPGYAALLLAKEFGISTDEAAQFVESAPCTIKSGISLAEAEPFIRALLSSRGKFTVTNERTGLAKEYAGGAPSAATVDITKIEESDVCDDSNLDDSVFNKLSASETGRLPTPAPSQQPAVLEATHDPMVDLIGEEMSGSYDALGDEPVEPAGMSGFERDASMSDLIREEIGHTGSQPVVDDVGQAGTAVDQADEIESAINDFKAMMENVKATPTRAMPPPVPGSGSSVASEAGPDSDASAANFAAQLRGAADRFRKDRDEAPNRELEDDKRGNGSASDIRGVPAPHPTEKVVCHKCGRRTAKWIKCSHCSAKFEAVVYMQPSKDNGKRLSPDINGAVARRRRKRERAEQARRTRVMARSGKAAPSDSSLKSKLVIVVAVAVGLALGIIL